MSTHQLNRPAPTTAPTDDPSASANSSRVSSARSGRSAGRALAVLRIATGFVFLWAFLDKTFGFGYATPSAAAWIHGGSPTKGFLSSIQVGPFQSFFHAIAGLWWADALFMVGMLAVGVALIAGAGVRLAALAGAVLMAMMWFAEFPLAQHTSSGAATGSSNPLVDYHFLYAAVLLVLAGTSAGMTWGLGRRWARIPFIARHPIAL